MRRQMELLIDGPSTASITLVPAHGAGAGRDMPFMIFFAEALTDTGFAVEGGINGELFRAWGEQHLAPALKTGRIVVMDNLSSHKVSRHSPSHRSGRRRAAIPAPRTHRT